MFLTMKDTVWNWSCDWRYICFVSSCKTTGCLTI